MCTLFTKRRLTLAAERERLKKELEQIEKEIGNGQRQLSNEQFLAKGPGESSRRHAGAGDRNCQCCGRRHRVSWMS